MLLSECYRQLILNWFFKLGWLIWGGRGSALYLSELFCPPFNCEGFVCKDKYCGRDFVQVLYPDTLRNASINLISFIPLICMLLSNQNGGPRQCEFDEVLPWSEGAGLTEVHQVGGECSRGQAYTTGPLFIKHLKSNVYVTLNAIGSFLCNLCFHWLIQIFIT